MTPDEILTVLSGPASRESDAIIAEHVMGLDVRPHNLLGRGDGAYVWINTGKTILCHPPIRYTGDISAAWAVDDEMNRRNFILVLRRGASACDAMYYKADDPDISFKAQAGPSEAPLAICRAAYLAAGVTI